MNPIDRIFERFDRHGGNDYGGERVRQLEHALQCATLAQAEGAEAPLITAALVHDIGHLIHDLGENPAAHGVDDRHELRGREWLARWFGEAVTEPVRLHVNAKRYLTATDPGYFATLSAGSVVSCNSGSDCSGTVGSGSPAGGVDAGPRVLGQVLGSRADAVSGARLRQHEREVGRLVQRPRRLAYLRWRRMVTCMALIRFPLNSSASPLTD